MSVFGNCCYKVLGTGNKLEVLAFNKNGKIYWSFCLINNC